MPRTPATGPSTRRGGRRRVRQCDTQAPERGQEVGLIGRTIYFCMANGRLPRKNVLDVLDEWVRKGLLTSEEHRTLKDRIGPRSPSLPVVKFIVHVGGGRWQFHQNDVDPHPSNPHGHDYDAREVLDPFSGDIFAAGSSRRSPRRRRLTRKQMEDLWSDPDFQDWFERARSVVGIGALDAGPVEIVLADDME